MDTVVPTSESQNLYNLLTAAGADTALHFVAGAGLDSSTPATACPDAEMAIVYVPGQSWQSAEIV